MSNISTLSALIAGEAQGGNQADQFGVAATIQNRADANYGGLGGVFGQAFNHNQFEAYPNALGTPTPYTDQLATAMSNGTLSSYGNTGNALYYNAPNYNAAYASGTGNNYGSGSNQYSDLYNKAPSSNFQLPQAGSSGAGTSSVAGVLTMNSDQSDALFASAANQGVGADTPNLQDSDFDGLSDSDIVGTGTPLPNDPASSIQSVNSGTLAQSLGGGGTPIDITDFSGPDTAISGAGTAVQKGANTVGSDVQQSAGGITGTIASVFNAGESYFSSAVIIIALVILGLVFVAFGLGMFKHGLVPQVA